MKDKNRITPDLITELKPHEVFVFGSNLSGKHGGGAARVALQWGAEHGNAVGPQGQTYAIPSLGKMNGPTPLEQLDLTTIQAFVDAFAAYAQSKPAHKFYVTPIGCGIAGFTAEDIAPIFEALGPMDNVTLPESFWAILQQDTMTD